MDTSREADEVSRMKGMNGSFFAFGMGVMMIGIVRLFHQPGWFALLLMTIGFCALSYSVDNLSG